MSATKKTWQLALLGIAMAVVSGLCGVRGAWWAVDHGSASRELGRAAETADATPPPLAAAKIPHLQPKAATLTRQAAPTQPAAQLESEQHPHPITPEHRVIQRELQLIGALNDALDLHDAPGLRALIAVHEREYPSDENALRAGYSRIADCFEDPGERTRTAALDYYGRERASTLRRYVRRACLEARD
jgi:hypothetical protein